MDELFGTDGIRGVAYEDLTCELVGRVGRALASACREGSVGAPCDRPRVVIGRDTRLSGPDLEAATVEGLRSGGADVILVGVLPTAGVAHLVGALGAQAGIVVSASHNPAPDNGLKIFGPGGWKLPTASERRIAELVASPGDTSVPEGEAEQMPDALEAYVDHLVATLSTDLGGLRVVVDCADGSGSRAAPMALERAGASVVAIHADGDGSRINDERGALHPQVVAAEARRLGAIGLTLDGDADRVLLADEEGRVVDGDGIIALLAGHTSLAREGIVVTVMSNQALHRWCGGHGIRVVQTPVGDRHVLEALREHGLVLGGEQAGHIVRLDRSTTGDGILVGLSVLEVVARSGGWSEATPSSGRLAELVPFRPLPQVMVNVEAGRLAPDRLTEAEAVGRAVSAAERTLGADGRVLVRPSGTEPVVRVMVEAPEEDLARELARTVAEAVRHELNGSGAEGA